MYYRYTIIIPIHRDLQANTIFSKSLPILFPKVFRVYLSRCCPAHVLGIRNDKTRAVLDRVRYTRRDIAPMLCAGTLIAK